MATGKKYNPHKHTQRVTDKFLDELMIVFVGGARKHSIFYLRNQRKFIFQIPQAWADLVIKRKHQWTVYASILCRDQQCNNYTKAVELAVDCPVYQDDFADCLTQWHYKLMDEGNPQHFLTAAWIAAPKDLSFDVEEAYSLFDKLDGFNFLAKWQMPEPTLNEQLAELL